MVSSLSAAANIVKTLKICDIHAIYSSFPRRHSQRFDWPIHLPKRAPKESSAISRWCKLRELRDISARKRRSGSEGGAEEEFFKAHKEEDKNDAFIWESVNVQALPDEAFAALGRALPADIRSLWIMLRHSRGAGV